MITFERILSNSARSSAVYEATKCSTDLQKLDSNEEIRSRRDWKTIRLIDGWGYVATSPGIWSLIFESCSVFGWASV